MFCLHNETDLRPALISIEKTDWVTVQCKICKAHIGDRMRLIDLVDEGIKRSKQELKELTDPDFEP